MTNIPCILHAQRSQLCREGSGLDATERENKGERGKTQTVSHFSRVNLHLIYFSAYDEFPV